MTAQIGRAALIDPLTILIAMAAFGVIWKWPLASPGVVVAAAMIGMARYAFS